MKSRGKTKKQKVASANRHSLQKNNRNKKLSQNHWKKIQTEFITSVSHQLFTPLSSMLSSIELLKFYIKKENLSRQNEILDRIKKSIITLSDTLSRITEYYKYQSLKQKLNYKKTDIRKFINDLLQETAVIIGDRHIVIINIQDDLKYITIDEFILKQILTNLISNAVKFSPEGGQIRLEVYWSKREIRFSIKDEGIGISKSDLRKIFQPFFRGENSVSIPGVGLGLTIVKKFTDMLNASIKCHSIIGQGSEFNLSIPMRM